MRLATAVDEVERRIVEALPDIVDGLIARARDGDTKAALYLVDRVLGKTAGTRYAPAEDKRLPYTDEDLAGDIQARDGNRQLSRLLASIGGSE